MPTLALAEEAQEKKKKKAHSALEGHLRRPKAKGIKRLKKLPQTANLS